MNPSTFELKLSEKLIEVHTAVTENYARALEARSKKEFNGSLKICLKKLKETRLFLRVMKDTHEANEARAIQNAIEECNDLITILSKSKRIF